MKLLPCLLASVVIPAAQSQWDLVTTIGGPGTDSVQAVAVLPEGSTYAAGNTTSLGPPFAPGEPGIGRQQGFLTRWDPSGRLVFSKLIRGADIRAMTADAEGNAYLSGGATAPEFETTAGSFQPSANGGGAFVMKISPSGETIFATYFGNLNAARALTIALDPENHIQLCGTSRADAIPLTDKTLFPPPTSVTQVQNGFCARLSGDGARLLFSTMFAATGSVTPLAAASDSAGNIIVGGATTAIDFPAFNAWQAEDRRRTLFQSSGARSWQALGDHRTGTVNSIQFVGGRIYLGSDAVSYVSEDQGVTWSALAVGGPLVVHARNTRYMCSATASRQLACSTDGGQTRTLRILSGVTGVVQDPRAEGAFIVGKTTGLESVNLAGGALPLAAFREAVDSMAIQIEGEQFSLWVTNQQGLFSLEDNGAAWKRITDNARLVAPGPRGSGVIYAMRHSRQPNQSMFIRSTDGGASWADIGAGFAPGSVLEMTVDPRDSRSVYLASGEGGFRSIDGGQSWQGMEDEGLGNRAARTFAFDPEGRPWVGARSLSNGFLIKLNPRDPAVVFSTLLAGSGGASITGLAQDAEGRIVISGSTASADMPITGEALLPPNTPAAVGLAGKFSEGGSLESLRVVGSVSGRVTLDPQGNAHFAGSVAASAALPPEVPSAGGFSGGSDVLWLTLDADLVSLLQATWLGGAGIDTLNSMAVGADGRMSLGGSTTSSDLPVTPGTLPLGSQTEGFLAIGTRR